MNLHLYECLFNETITLPNGKHFKRTVDCPELKDGKNKCEKCGWNPKVESARKEKIFHPDLK